MDLCGDPPTDFFEGELVREELLEAADSSEKDLFACSGGGWRGDWGVGAPDPVRDERFAAALAGFASSFFESAARRLL